MRIAVKQESSSEHTSSTKGAGHTPSRASHTAAAPVTETGADAAEAEPSGRKLERTFGAAIFERPHSEPSRGRTPVQRAAADRGGVRAEPGHIPPSHQDSAPGSEDDRLSDRTIHEAAWLGTRGLGGPLPYLGQIQRAFGRHDVAGVVAHTDDRAAQGARAMGASAFTMGNHVAFAGLPSLHTAAHEAAHVVQQRGGIQLPGGVGASGDRHERHADAVAEAVVSGRSAEPLLDADARSTAVAWGGPADGGSAAIQLAVAPGPRSPQTAGAAPPEAQRATPAGTAHATPEAAAPAAELEGPPEELVQLTEPSEHAQLASPDVGMTKTVADTFRDILDHWESFQFDERYIEQLTSEQAALQQRLHDVRAPFKNQRQRLVQIGRLLARYLAMRPKARQALAGAQAVAELDAQELELEARGVVVRTANEKTAGWTNRQQRAIQQQIHALDRRKPAKGSEEQTLVDRIGAISSIRNTARKNFADAKQWINRVRTGYRGTATGTQDANELAAGELASMSTAALCNVISYWLYGTATKRETRSFPAYFREELQRGLISAQGVRYKEKLIAVKGIYYGTGSQEWRHRWGMRSLVHDRIPLGDRRREAERNDFLSSGATLAISYQAFSGRTPHHFLLIYKDTDGWHNLDHTSTSPARRFGATSWSQVFGVYFNDALDPVGLRQLWESFFGNSAESLLKQLFPRAAPPEAPAEH
ncbi:MAG TPA: DUF4157 domain-containing protein [Kofleriaceae bacterium]